MTLPDRYHALQQQSFAQGEYRLVPIRYEDRMAILKWRNEQIYHLRQEKPLTEADQERYFTQVVARLFEAERPPQLLFSYLKGDECIGYGGLVHINWTDRHAEISFIINTELEKDGFKKHWGIYLDLLEQIAFDELNLHKIYTYAFDLRPHLYEAVEAKGFTKEAVLKEHCYFNGEYKDVVFHAKIDAGVRLRSLQAADKQITFEWATDEVTRTNSFNADSIRFEDHSRWIDKKLADPDSRHFICEVNGQPAGLVRFDEYNGQTTVGITVGKEFRGKKLAPVFLRKGCREYRKYNSEKIHAYIKKENLASRKAFEKAGFIYTKETEVGGVPALEYIYTGNGQ